MILVLALFVAIAGLVIVAFIIVVAGIRQTDRQMSLRGPSRNHADSFARKITGAYADVRSNPRR